MTNEKQQNRKTFIDCYRIGRSLEYMDRYDQEPVSYTHLRAPRDLSTSRMPSSA